MNLHSIFSAKYREGYLGGQCAQWAHLLVDFPSVGDSYRQKQQAVKQYGITRDALVCFHQGDVVITSDGTFMGFGNGHVFIVMDQDKDNLYAAESNFNNDLSVHYGRKVPKNSPKIYGVIRGAFKFDIPATLNLNTWFLMQYQKQWNSSVFGKIVDRIKAASNNSVIINPIDLYTYNSLKNWDYKIYGTGFGDMFSLISQDYFNNMVMGLTSNAQAIIWAINKQQWQGSVLNQPNNQEIGWYFRPSLPAQIEISCEENDISPVDSRYTLFEDAAFHELSHFFYTYGRADQVDNTHNRHFGWNGFEKNLDKIFEDIDLKRLIINL